MSPVLRYTLARLGLFVLAFALVWAVGGAWLVWDETTVLWTALLALGLSAVASFVLLGRLRGEMAERVQQRAQRVARAIDESRRAEDD